MTVGIGAGDGAARAEPPVNGDLFPSTLVRPRASDAAVRDAAIAAFAVMVAKSLPSYLEGEPVENFERDLRECLAGIPDDDGAEIAREMNRRADYPMDEDAVEMMGRYSGYLDEAHEDAMRAWVSVAAPTPPFDGLARVQVPGRQRSGVDGDGFAEGVAYRERRGDALARCLFVPHADRARFMMDGAFAGGWVVDWEDVTVIGEPTVADRAADAARLAGEQRQLRERAYRDFAHGVDKSFAGAVRAVDAETTDMAPKDLRDYLLVSMEFLCTALAEGKFDPFSPQAAQVASTLGRLQALSKREAFASVWELPKA